MPQLEWINSVGLHNLKGSVAIFFIIYMAVNHDRHSIFWSVSLRGKNTPETRLEFAKTLPSYIPPEPFRWIGAQITMYALDTVDEKGGWRKLWLAMVEKMGFPVTQ